MGAERNTQTFNFSGTVPFNANSVISSMVGRNLEKHQLGGVIFGCKNSTMKECLSKQLFGLPAQHFSYVRNIEPGLPLFLFNYNERKLYGIFEAASKGTMYIDPYGWTADGSERTQYPAQVQIRVRLQCQPLSEDKFRQIIADNYYKKNHNYHKKNNYYKNDHFWFELDHGQAGKLMALMASLAIAPGTSIQRNTMKWRTVSQSLPSHKNLGEGELCREPDLDIEHSTYSSRKSDSTEVLSSLDGDIQLLDSQIDVKEVEQDERNLIYMKLKQLAFLPESQDLSLSADVKDMADLSKNMCSTDNSYTEASTYLAENKEVSFSHSFEYQSTIAQLMQEVRELKAFKATLTEKNSYLEQKLIQAEMEIQHLKDRCLMLESACNLSVAHVEKMAIQPSAELCLDPKESFFLIGGFDGESLLDTMDLYCPSLNVIKSLGAMSLARSYASAAQLNGEIYVFGGGSGFNEWYDTVESYNPTNNQWTLCTPLNQKKGSLAGAPLNNKIFAIGGGNGIESLSDVEMLDLDIGRWIFTRSMMHKRFALAAVELNGVIYATGGFDGNDYLQSAERFDPREHSWTKMADMNTKRGCHSLVVLNEKLYALGGFDGETMVPTVEVYDPRLGTWMMGEPMIQSRGYSAAAVVNESIYIVGGVKAGENIVDTVEIYKEGQGWKETGTSAVGKRCFMSAIAPLVI